METRLDLKLEQSCCKLITQILYIVFFWFQDKRAKGETVFEISTTRLQQLPIINFAAKDYGEKKQKFGFKAGPVCFNWEPCVVNAAVFKHIFETWVHFLLLVHKEML